MSALKNGATELARASVRDRTFVLAKQSPHCATPYVTWELDAEGNAYSGHYHTSHDDGLAELSQRAFG